MSQTTPQIEELRKHYIALSKSFFEKIGNGKKPEELQQLRAELDKTLLELDALEKQSAHKDADR